MFNNIVLVGASGAIGSALVSQLSKLYIHAKIHAFSRNKEGTFPRNVDYHTIDYEDESSIERCANIASEKNPIDLLVVATGMLHDKNIMPEKSIRDLSAYKMRKIYEVNTIIPTLIGKYFLPKMIKNDRYVAAFLSARVGSISDNYLGGWYSYRASKAALNMIVKNFSIEMQRKNKESIIIGLHPGTVESNLSEPFKDNIKEDKLFKPEFSAKALIAILRDVSSKNTGKCFGWDGQVILP